MIIYFIKLTSSTLPSSNVYSRKCSHIKRPKNSVTYILRNGSVQFGSNSHWWYFVESATVRVTVTHEKAFSRFYLCFKNGFVEAAIEKKWKTKKKRDLEMVFEKSFDNKKLTLGGWIIHFRVVLTRNFVGPGLTVKLDWP